MGEFGGDVVGVVLRVGFSIIPDSALSSNPTLCCGWLDRLSFPQRSRRHGLSVPTGKASCWRFGAFWQMDVFSERLRWDGCLFRTLTEGNIFDSEFHGFGECPLASLSLPWPSNKKTQCFRHLHTAKPLISPHRSPISSTESTST